MWMFDSLVTCPSPHLGALAWPSTPKMLRAKEHTLIPYPSIIFTFGLTVETIKELGGASSENSFLSVSSISRHFIASNPFSSYFNNNIVKNIYFGGLSFLLPWFFLWAWAIWVLKVSHCPLRGPLGVSCQFFLLNLKNLEKFIPTIMNVLHGFHLHVFKLEAFISTSMWKLIVDFFY